MSSKQKRPIGDANEEMDPNKRPKKDGERPAKNMDSSTTFPLGESQRDPNPTTSPAPAARDTWCLGQTRRAIFTKIQSLEGQGAVNSQQNVVRENLARRRVYEDMYARGCGSSNGAAITANVEYSVDVRLWADHVQNRTSEEFPWEQPEMFREDTGYADFVKSIAHAGKWSVIVLDDDETIQGQRKETPAETEANLTGGAKDSTNMSARIDETQRPSDDRDGNRVSGDPQLVMRNKASVAKSLTAAHVDPVLKTHDGGEATALYNEQYRQRAGGLGGFGGNMNASPASFNQQQQQPQQQPQQQVPVLPQPILGVQRAPLGQHNMGVTHNVNAADLPAAREELRQETGIQNQSLIFSSGQPARELQGPFRPRAMRSERERMRRRQQVDIMSVPVLGVSDPPRPAQPQQRQAGRGALPGARNAQPNRPGVGLLGNHRVERPGAARGQGQQQRLGAGPGSNRGGRSAHTDHPPGFACRICGETDHMEADCAKPSSRAGDSTYCPYHRSVSGSEAHADSKCRKCVDKCWEAAVDQDGSGFTRAEIDRLVTDFVRRHRGGRPEPRCANVHSHWAMSVSRYIRMNGQDGIEASLLPVRRSEVLRRKAAGQLSWQQFDHRNVEQSRTQFRDTHWECDTPAQLITKLQNYARTGKYQSASQRRQRRPAQGEVPAEQLGDGMAVEKNASSEEDMSGPSTPSHDDSWSDVGSGWEAGEEYAPDSDGEHHDSDDDDAMR